MNLFQLIFKQMRQRALSSVLTCLAVTLAAALGMSISVIQAEGRNILAQSDYGYDMIVGPKGSGFDLVLNTVYHMGVSQGNLPYGLYEDMTGDSAMSVEFPGKKNPYHGLVQWAVPYAVGDSYMGRRIVGTTAQLFGMTEDGKPLPAEDVPEIRKGERYTFAEGRAFNGRKFEAVVGSEIASKLGLTVGKKFQATHGVPTPTFTPFDIHPEIWTVVGVLNPTHTANDRVLFIPLPTFYAIFEHTEGLEKIAEVKSGGKEGGSQKPEASSQKSEVATAPVPTPMPVVPGGEVVPDNEGYTTNADGTINNRLPKADWEVSAILVKSKSAATMLQIDALMRISTEAMGVRPAQVMGDFFDQVMPRLLDLLLVIAGLVLVVSAVSVLVSIYNSVAGRSREIAIMRALGATRVRILAIVCMEAGLIGLMGGVLGILAGHGLAACGSVFLRAVIGQGLPWWHFSLVEVLYLGVVVVVSLLAGLVPALKAYGTPVAENLVAS